MLRLKIGKATQTNTRALHILSIFAHNKQRPTHDTAARVEYEYPPISGNWLLIHIDVCMDRYAKRGTSLHLSRTIMAVLSGNQWVGWFSWTLMDNRWVAWSKWGVVEKPPKFIRDECHTIVTTHETILCNSTLRMDHEGARSRRTIISSRRCA